MVTVSGAVARVQEILPEIMSEEAIAEDCRKLGHRWRRRKLDPRATILLFLSQLLKQMSLQGLLDFVDEAVSAAAICKARQRLPVQLFRLLAQRSVPGDRIAKVWHGLTVYIVDGMAFKTPDDEELAKKYRKAKNQKGVSGGYPIPKMMGTLEKGGCYLTHVTVLPGHRQEATVLTRVFRMLPALAVLLGDRAMVGFAQLAMLMASGRHGCFGLSACKVVGKTGDNAGKRGKSKKGGKGRKGKKGKKAAKRKRRVLRDRRAGKSHATHTLIANLGPKDKLVRWVAGKRPPWLGLSRWQAIAPVQLTLRQIEFQICRKGHRAKPMWLLTTLTDAKEYPAEEVVELYGKRWQIEVCFRDLKSSMKMKMMRSRTVKGVEKEVLAFVTMYNLVRRVMEEAAARQGVEPDRISFKDATNWLMHAKVGCAMRKLVVNKKRVRKCPERRLKKIRTKYPPLIKSRNAGSKPPCGVSL